MAKSTKRSGVMPAAVEHKSTPFRVFFRSHYWLYILIIPGVLYMLCFNYLPMLGLVMAFQDFNPYNGDTILGAFLYSPWVGLDVFKEFVF